MRMKVFLDTNILLDIIEERKQFLVEATNVLNLGVLGKIDLYASPLTFANCLYVARKNVGYDKAIRGLRSMKSFIKAAAMTDEQCNKAINSNMPDFEDMLQYESALGASCDVIVTRNKKHFPQDGIPVLDPKEFLNTYSD